MAALLACTRVPEPGENQIRYAEQHGYVTTLADLRQGRQLMMMKCGRCHALPRVFGSRRNPETWPVIMDSMKIEANLSPREDSLIRTFLIVTSGNWRDSLAALKALKAQ